MAVFAGVLVCCCAVPAAGSAPEMLPGGFAVEFDTDRAAAPAPRTDPRLGRRFARTAVVWGPGDNEQAGAPRRRVASIHYQDADARLARQTARLCARLLRLYQEHFGRPVAFLRGAPEAHVYLCADDAAPALKPPAASMPGSPLMPVLGGQTWGENVWLFAGRGERAPAPMEWTRTVAHEWGHLTLWPAARGYVEPEREAAGFLGERLYLKWLREDAARRAPATPGPPQPPDDGVDRAGLDTYYVRQIAPLITRFQTTNGGPDAPVLRETGTRAMDQYIGGILASDDAFGSGLVGDALTSVLGDRPHAFFDRLREAAGGAPVLNVRLPAWVPLAPETAYRVSRAPTTLATSVSPVRLAIADRPPFVVGAAGTSLTVRGSGGWRWARVAGAASPPVSVRFQRLSRRGSGRL